jgi:hypothetical protein
VTGAILGRGDEGVRATFSDRQRRQRLVNLDALLRPDVRSWASVRPPPEERARRARGEGSRTFLGRGSPAEDREANLERETNGIGEEGDPGRRTGGKNEPVAGNEPRIVRQSIELGSSSRA